MARSVTKSGCSAIGPVTAALPGSDGGAIFDLQVVSEGRDQGGGSDGLRAPGKQPLVESRHGERKPCANPLMTKGLRRIGTVA